MLVSPHLANRVSGLMPRNYAPRELGRAETGAGLADGLRLDRRQRWPGRRGRRRPAAAQLAEAARERPGGLRSAALRLESPQAALELGELRLAPGLAVHAGFALDV